MGCDQKAANVAVARIIPVILGGMIGYASWVVTKKLTIDYLLNPAPRHLQNPRVGAGAGILVVYYILLFPVLACYFRLLHEIIWNPGFLPRGPQWLEQQKETEKTTRRKQRGKLGKSYNTAREKRGDLLSPEPGVSDGNDIENGLSTDEDGLEKFYTKDVFIGLAIAEKSVDVSEKWTTFALGLEVLSVKHPVYVAELRKKTGVYNVHWLVVLGMSALFFLFTLGMAGSSLQFAMINSTTVENLTRRRKVWTLAIHVPRHVMESNPHWASTIPTVSYPFPGEFVSPPNSSHSQRTPEHRVFAIVETKPGENPFDLGSRLANVKEVMGYTILEWLLPLQHSPCTNHGGKESAYAMGPALQRLKKEAGLEYTPQKPQHEDTESSDQRKRRRKKQRRSRGDRPTSGNIEETSTLDQNEVEIQEPAEAHVRLSD
ncbi:palmitoyltransferase pfa5 [Arachnomyces sp. PD_36]|nr:palmitoyltransferase pfa5 [Arachnomyces sp. PD_36]